jgi:hypothetical protein
LILQCTGSPLGVHRIGTPVMGIELLGCHPHWTSPQCEIGIPTDISIPKQIFKGTIARKDKHSGTARVVRVLGNGQDDCKWRWYDASLVSRARSFESQDPMGGACSSSLNRPVWTRMPWRLGDGARKQVSLPELRRFSKCPVMVDGR